MVSASCWGNLGKSAISLRTSTRTPLKKLALNSTVSKILWNSFFQSRQMRVFSTLISTSVRHPSKTGWCTWPTSRSFRIIRTISAKSLQIWSQHQNLSTKEKQLECWTSRAWCRAEKMSTFTLGSWPKELLTMVAMSFLSRTTNKKCLQNSTWHPWKRSLSARKILFSKPRAWKYLRIQKSTILWSSHLCAN